MRNVRMCFPIKLVLLCSLLTAHCSLLFAQDGETRFIQRLTWTGDEYARRYEVVIEKEEGGAYREILREFTTALYIEVYLLPGKYRCRVITHDYLDQLGEASEWRYMEVLDRHSEHDDGLPEFSLSDTGSPADKTDDTPGRFKVNLFLSAAWLPSFAIYDKENFSFGRGISLAGVAGRFGAVLSGTNFENYFNFNPGLELAVSYNFFDAGSGTDSGRQVHLLSFALNLLAQKRVPEGNLDPSGSRRRIPGDKTALTFRLGAGYSVISPEDGAAHVNIGVSFLLFVTDYLFLETGIDYAHLFTDPPSGCLRPWVGVGWRF